MEDICIEEGLDVDGEYIRYTDNCSGQYKSKHVNNNLLNIRKIMPSLKSARFSYFEPNEGKNSSDGIGSCTKQAIKRETLTALEGFDNDRTAMAEELCRRVLSGLRLENGGVGTFTFFRYK